MQTTNEIRARLNHGAHEILQTQELLATVTDRLQIVLDQIRLCNSRTELIEPTIDTLKHQIHTLNEEMDRVYALRNNESDLYLRQENVRLKKDIVASHQALRREMEEGQTRITELVKSNENLRQRVGSLERLNDVLKSKTNEMKEQYESAIIDNVDLRDANADLKGANADLRDTNAGLKDTVKTLQTNPAFNIIADAPASGHANRDRSPGSIPFGKTVVETNRGLTVTIESSPESSPEKASLHHDWIPQIPSGAVVPFPDIASQPQVTTEAPANGGSTRPAIPDTDRPKGNAIVKGTKEANESFERMMRVLSSSPLPKSTNVINVDNNATAASSSSPADLAMPVIKPFGVHPVTPSKVKSKLNSTVEAFTPSNTSDKAPAKSGSIQAFSPSKKELKPSVTATATKEEAFIPPHLRRLPKIPLKEDPVTAIEEQYVKERIEAHDTFAKSAQKESAKEAKPVQATSSSPRVLPHLRRLNKAVKNEDVHPSQAQFSANGEDKEAAIEGTGSLSGQPALTSLTSMKENVKATAGSGAFMGPDPGLPAWLDTQETIQSNNASTHESASMANEALIQIDPYDSPKAGKKKTVPLPPGFIPDSTKDASIKTETAAPHKSGEPAFPIASHYRVTHRNSTVEDEGAAPGRELSVKVTSEKEKNAAFVAEYDMRLSSVSEKYGKDSRQGLDAKEDGVEPIKYGRDDIYYAPPRPNGTHELGALLDDECSGLVLKPGKGVNMEIAVQEWKAVRKDDGKVVYVL